MVLSSAFAVHHLGSLDNVLLGDVGMVLNRLQSQTMVFPCCQVIGAVHTDTTTFNLPLNLVLSEQEELARILVNGNTSSVGVHQVSSSVSPPGTRNDPFSRDRSRSQQKLRRKRQETHCVREENDAG